MIRTARTSDRGSRIVASAGIAVPVLPIAPGAQVPECSAAGRAAVLRLLVFSRRGPRWMASRVVGYRIPFLPRLSE